MISAQTTKKLDLTAIRRVATHIEEFDTNQSVDSYWKEKKNIWYRPECSWPIQV